MESLCAVASILAGTLGLSFYTFWKGVGYGSRQAWLQHEEMTTEAPTIEASTTEAPREDLIVHEVTKRSGIYWFKTSQGTIFGQRVTGGSMRYVFYEDPSMVRDKRYLEVLMAHYFKLEAGAPPQDESTDA